MGRVQAIQVTVFLLLMTVGVAHGRSLDPQLGTMEKDPIPPSRPNPVTNIPGPPANKTSQSVVVGNRVAPSLKKASARPPAAPNGHNVDPLLGSVVKGPVLPSASNPLTNIPGPPANKTGESAVVAAPNGHSVDPLLDSMEEGPVLPSAPNPVTYIPGPPSAKAAESAGVGHRVAPSLGSPKKGIARPPAAPNGDSIAPSTTYP